MNFNKLGNLEKLQTFKKFLDEHKYTLKKGEHTHTYFGNYTVTYKIDDDDLPMFMQMYKKLLNIKKDMHFMETQMPIGPYLIDIDLKHTEEDRQYTEDHILQTIKITTSIIKEYFQIKTVDAYVMEKPTPTFEEKNKVYKDGFHIVYPYGFSQKARKIIYEKMKQEIDKKKIFENINNLNDKFIDSSVVTTNQWFMVGSGKFGQNRKYEVTSIYNSKCEKINKELKEEDFVSILSLKRFGIDDEVNFKEMYKNNLNIKKEKDIKEEYNELHEKIKKKKDPNPKKRPTEIVETAQKLVRLLSSERADTYEKWTLVGWALYSISEDLYDDFVWFSQLCPDKYNENACYNFWQKAEKKMHGIKALHLWAKNDNPEGYEAFARENLKSLLLLREFNSHTEIAAIIYEMYKYDYVCTCFEKQEWYEFKNHRWQKVPKGYTLKERICTEFVAQLLSLMSILTLNNGKSDIKKGEKDVHIFKLKELTKNISNLQSEPFLENLMKSCGRKFYDKDFIEKLDENRFIFVCENGVLDLEKRIFREGLPEDYASLSCGYNYVEYNYNDEIVILLRKFMASLQQDEEMLEYLYRYISSFLEGYIRSEMFVIWTGSGGNGKSALVKLIEKTFGKYFGTMSTTIITQKKTGSSNAQPELENKKGKRVVVLNEPDKDETIRVGQLKLLTGDDTIEVRGMYKEPITFTPQFKFMLLCNQMPSIPVNDNGTWRRIRCVPFETEFVDGEPEKKNQIKKDENIKKIIPLFPQPLLWLLFKKYYPLYADNGLKEPEKVTSFTKKYRQINDQIAEFVNDVFDISNESKDKISINDFYSEFMTWCKTSSNYAKPKKKEIVEYVENNFKVKIINTYIHNIKKKSIESSFDFVV